MLVFHRPIFIEKFGSIISNLVYQILLQFVGSVKLATVQRKYLKEIENLLLLLPKRKLEA